RRHRGPARRRGSRARTGAARAGAPRDDRRPSRCGLRARDRRRTPVVRGRLGGQGAPGGPSTPPPIALTQSQRPPEAATSRAPGSRATTLAPGARTLTTHTRLPPPQALSSRAASQNTSRASGRSAPKASTLRRPSTIGGRCPVYHSSAPEFSSGPSWTSRSSGRTRRASSRPIPWTARWAETRLSAAATEGSSASIEASTTNVATRGRRGVEGDREVGGKPVVRQPERRECGQHEDAHGPEREGDPGRLARISPRAPPHERPERGAGREDPGRRTQERDHQKLRRGERHVL